MLAAPVEISATTMTPGHQPVMLREVLELLAHLLPAVVVPALQGHPAKASFTLMEFQRCHRHGTGALCRLLAAALHHGQLATILQFHLPALLVEVMELQMFHRDRVCHVFQLDVPDRHAVVLHQPLLQAGQNPHQLAMVKGAAGRQLFPQLKPM